VTKDATKKPFRIFLVEDNAADVYLLEKALQDRGLHYELILFEDGERGVNALAASSSPVPDLILLDLNLPRRDGFEVLAVIRGNPSLVGVPVGILTSSDSESDRHRVRLLAVERFIHKPAVLEEFVQTVGRSVDDLLRQRTAARVPS
jgi:chemotaxis family two-component system response regulator Rcp1